MTNDQAQAPDDEAVEDLDEVNEVITTSYAITAYGADYPVDGLVKRLNQDDIVVPLFSMQPEDGQSTVGFQRGFVWTKPQADRFVESLLLGLPVPGIFLVKEANGKHLVLDGQQRLKTLQGFYAGLFQSKEFVLDKVQEKWRGRTYKSLHADDRRRLDDSIIHATIVRQDEPTEDQSSIYLIFERLNSGGTFLQPQEIRVALYHGKFAALLSELNDNPHWRALYGKKSARLKDLELILRFFALHFHEASYRRPMKEFLNRYMAQNVNLQSNSELQLRALFESTVALIHAHIGPRAFRLKNAVNAAVVDAVLIGAAHHVALGSKTPATRLKAAYEDLLKNNDFLAATTRATADEESIKKRLRLAREAFSPSA